MRVLLVNKFFRSFGGPESLMFRQAEMLRAHGHEVAFLSMDHPDNLPSEWAPYFVSNVELSGGGKAGSLGGKLRTAGRILYSREARRKTLALVDRFKPDVAICHNIYHQLSPSVVSGLRARRVRTLLFSSTTTSWSARPTAFSRRTGGASGASGATSSTPCAIAAWGARVPRAPCARWSAGSTEASDSTPEPTSS